MGIIKQFKTFITNIDIFPITKTNAVYHSDGRRLDVLLKNFLGYVDTLESVNLGGLIRSLKNPFTGVFVFPVTKTSAIYDDLGNRLDKYLEGISNSNSNILINANFKNPINQRGITESTSDQVYTYDRWVSGYLKLDGNVITTTRENGNSWIYQRIEEGMFTDDEEVTISAKINGEIYKGTSIIKTSSIESAPILVEFNGGYLSVWRGEDTGCQQAGIIFTRNGVFEVDWVKLEIGGVATPFTPRLYAEELQLCKRYFERLGENRYSVYPGIKSGSDGKYYFLINYCQKRIIPTVVLPTSASMHVNSPSGGDYSGTNGSNGEVYNATTEQAKFSYEISSSMEQPLFIEMLLSSFDTHIDVDAEL